MNLLLREKKDRHRGRLTDIQIKQWREGPVTRPAIQKVIWQIRF